MTDGRPAAGGLLGALFAWFVRRAPATVRRQSGREMEELFADQYGDVRARRGAAAATLFALRAVAEVGLRSLSGRWDRLPHRLRSDGRPGRPPHPDVRSAPRLESISQDIRYAVRGLRKAPAFALVTTLTIGLGIGANVAIFSVVNAVLMRALPYEEPERLVYVWPQLRNRGVDRFAASPLDLRDFSEQTTLFEGFAGIVDFRSSIVDDEGEATRVDVRSVTPEFFGLLGVQPLLGRDFADEPTVDDEGAVDTLILSHELWQAGFGGDPAVVGRMLEVGDDRAEIIGVAPPGFRLYVPPGVDMNVDVDLWQASRIDPDEWATRRNVVYRVIGRLAPGVELAAAQAEMDAVAQRIAETDAAFQTAGYGIEVIPMQRDVTDQVRPLLGSLLGAVGFVLLIACANVSSLMLVRTTARTTEMAVRAALGAPRHRLARQLLVESAALAALGAAVGLMLAWIGIRPLLALAPPDLPRLDDVSIDTTVLVFTLGAAAASALLFGMLPALRAGGMELVAALKERGGTGGRGRHGALRVGVVVGEVALSVILLVGAGLMLRSFVELQRADPGFEPRGVLTFDVEMDGYSERDRRAFNRRLAEELRAAPGVEAVTGASQLPLGRLVANGRYGTEEALADETAYRQAIYRYVLPDYFETLRTELIEGTTFLPEHFDDDVAAVIVDAKVARLMWPGESAVGKRLLIRLRTPEPTWVDVVGVVEHQRSSNMAVDGRETIFFAMTYPGTPDTMVWAVRSAGDPTLLAGAVRRQVRELDPRVPVSDVRLLSDSVEESMGPTRFAMTLIGVFALLAVVMAAVGLYGVLAQSVRDRRTEIGLRMAIGARSRNVLQLVLAQGLVPTALGVAVGLVGAFWLTGFMASLLVDTAPTDTTTFVAVPLLFALVALLAILIPALRATRVEPVVALRDE